MNDEETREPLTPPTVREQLDEQLDKTLLGIIKDGITGVDKEGHTVTVPAPHQYFEIARKRLSDLGLTKEADPASDAAQLLRELNLSSNVHDMKLRPVSDEPDAATA